MPVVEIGYFNECRFNGLWGNHVTFGINKKIVMNYSTRTYLPWRVSQYGTLPVVHWLIDNINASHSVLKA